MTCQLFVYRPIGAERRVARLIRETATLIQEAESLLRDCSNDLFFSAATIDVVRMCSAKSSPLNASTGFKDEDDSLDVLAGPIAVLEAELLRLMHSHNDVTAVASGSAVQPPLKNADNETTMTDPPSAEGSDEGSVEASSTCSATTSSAGDSQSADGSDDTRSDDEVSLCAFLCVLWKDLC